MRILDVFWNLNRNRSESSELTAWHKRMQPFLGQEVENRHRICVAVIKQAFLATGEDPNNPLVKAVQHLCQELLDFDQHFYLPKIETKKSLTTAERWEAIAAIKRALVLFEDQEQLNWFIESLTQLVKNLIDSLPLINTPGEGDKLSLAVPLYSLLPDPAATIGIAVGYPFKENLVNAGFFDNLRKRLEYNLYIASKIDPTRPDDFRREVVTPEKANKPVEEVVAVYCLSLLVKTMDFSPKLLVYSLP